VLSLPGGHHYNVNYAALVGAIIEVQHSLASAQP
jgi:type IV secretory pathway VirJ component